MRRPPLEGDSLRHIRELLATSSYPNCIPKVMAVSAQRQKTPLAKAQPSAVTHNIIGGTVATLAGFPLCLGKRDFSHT